MADQQINTIKKFELEGTSCTALLDNGIIKIDVNDNVFFSLEIIIRVLKQRLDLQPDRKHLVLTNLGKNVTAPKETRDYSSGPEYVKFTGGMAIIASNIISKNLVNFFLMVSKPKVQTRAFKHETGAMKWLISINQEPIKSDDLENFIKEYSY